VEGKVPRTTNLGLDCEMGGKTSYRVIPKVMRRLKRKGFNTSELEKNQKRIESSALPAGLKKKDGIARTVLGEGKRYLAGGRPGPTRNKTTSVD